jgi:hypothetical protein
MWVHCGYIHQVAPSWRRALLGVACEGVNPMIQLPADAGSRCVRCGATHGVRLLIHSAFGTLGKACPACAQLLEADAARRDADRRFGTLEVST